MQTETTSSTPPTEGSRARPSPLTLPVILVGVVLVAMSISGAAVALPSLGVDLDASGSALNWVVAGYNLAFAAMTLVAGSTADRIGRRRVFVGSAMVFTAGFTVTALSPSILLIDVARVVSGLGGAGIMAAGGAVIAASYSGSVRTKAFALMGTMAGVGIALGPTLSGLLVSATGWRGGFAVFAVIGVAITIGATRLPESRAAVAGRSDWLGSALFVGALTALMFGILEAPTLGWKNPLVLLTVGGGLLLLVVFGVSQRRAASPVLSPSLVTNRGFMGWCLATLTTSVGFLGVLVFLPTYLQAVGNLSPATAGLAMLLLTAPVPVTPLGAAALVNRGVSPRILIVLALALVTAGNFGLMGLSADHPVAATAVPLLLIGVGMGVLRNHRRAGDEPRPLRHRGYGRRLPQHAARGRGSAGHRGLWRRTARPAHRASGRRGPRRQRRRGAAGRRGRSGGDRGLHVVVGHDPVGNRGVVSPPLRGGRVPGLSTSQGAHGPSHHHPTLTST
ncbi:MFS transporter [Spiractinospora alimapuensis]|uniref:MFS transporter n=1 Tax=Spiractinospora alimapuensis TaxID=2820884 RepID=UPI001F35B357|nr:MFS transporter [Spiractinospora alimapuensis]QVQ50466.1 MFS transporter [Spiractinospora alimapuensis]